MQQRVYITTKHRICLKQKITLIYINHIVVGYGLKLYEIQFRLIVHKLYIYTGDYILHLNLFSCILSIKIIEIDARQVEKTRSSNVF